MKCENKKRHKNMSTLEDEAVVEDEQFLETRKQMTESFQMFDHENSLLDGYLMHSNVCTCVPFFLSLFFLFLFLFF